MKKKKPEAALVPKPPAAPAPARNEKGHWLKGESPNPGGKPASQTKAHREFQAACREYTPEALDTLVIIMRGCRRDPKTGKVMNEIVDKSLARASADASVVLIERGYGKATQPIDLDPDHEHHPVLEALLMLAKKDGG